MTDFQLVGFLFSFLLDSCLSWMWNMDHHQDTSKTPRCFSTPGVCRRSYVFCIPGTLLTKQCKASPPAHQGRAGLSHSGWVSLDTLLIPLLSRTITVSVIAVAHRPPAGWMRPVGRRRTIWLRINNDDLQSLYFGIHKAMWLWTCGIKSSVWQHSTKELAKEESSFWCCAVD